MQLAPTIVLAFVISLVVLAVVAFRRRNWLLIAPTIILGLAAYGTSFLLPPRYVSESFLLLRPQSIPKELAPGLAEPSIEHRLDSWRSALLSRSGLRTLLNESELVSDLPIDRQLEALRRDISIKLTPNAIGTGATIAVSYTSAEPETARKVAQNLTKGLLALYSRLRQEQLLASVQFVDSRLESLAGRLTRHEALSAAGRDPAASLDYEALQSTYRAVHAQREELRSVETMLNRPQGEQLLVLDAATLPLNPVAPNRLAITAVGAVAGFAFGGVALAGRYRKQRRAAL